MRFGFKIVDKPSSLGTIKPLLESKKKHKLLNKNGLIGTIGFRTCETHKIGIKCDDAIDEIKKTHKAEIDEKDRALCMEFLNSSDYDEEDNVESKADAFDHLNSHVDTVVDGLIERYLTLV